MPYTPHTEEEINSMLEVIGVDNTKELFNSIPEELRMQAPLKLPEAMPEIDLTRHLKDLARKNKLGPKTLSFLGGGIYAHHVPAAVNDLAFRGEFLTPYTPYQPEISQGTLQVTFEFQSLMSRIFAMDIANASTYDASTSVGEAALMALRITKKRKKILVCDSVHPEYREVLSTVLQNFDVELITISAKQGKLNLDELKPHLDENLSALIVQYPNFFGIVENLTTTAKLVHQAGGLLITASAEPLAFGLFSAPGDYGVDIAVGEGNSFGMPTRFGGPALGVFTANKKYLRQMPGRLAGETVDSKGRKSYVLTLSTREQHIRREKATSNICSNHQHCATIATIYLSMLGKKGFYELAETNAAKAACAKTLLSKFPGVKMKFSGTYFNEFLLELPKSADEVLARLRQKDIYGGINVSKWYPQLENCILICCTELHKKSDIDRFAIELECALNQSN